MHAILNNCSNGFVKLSDLNMEVKYKVLSFRRLSTRYGQTVLVKYEDETGWANEVILPNR